MSKFQKYLDEITDISNEVFQSLVSGDHYERTGIFSTDQTHIFLKDYLNSKKSDKRPVIQLLGSPGSGKSQLAQKLAEITEGILFMATDEYNTGTREGRKIMAREGASELDVKDFQLLSTHIKQLKALGKNEIMMVPGPYDTATGTGLLNGLTKKATGDCQMVLIEGNFYVGKGGASDVDLDGVIYLHISDRNRLHVRLIRDLTDGQARGKDPEEIVEQYTTRQRSQDMPFTIPFMKNADILLHVHPNIENDEIGEFGFTVYKKRG